MKVIERIVKSPGSPPSKHDLWLDVSKADPELKAHLGDEWKSVAGGGSGSSISYEVQMLSDSQQAQARQNIGAAPLDGTLSGVITGTV